MTESSRSKLQQLRRRMAELESALICYSGGIDSALLLAVAHEQLGQKALGFTAVSPSLAPAERLNAEQFAREQGAQHILVESNEMRRPDYVKNGPDRCYHCKTELYELAERERRERGLQAIVNGTNADDLGDYRPGLVAASEASVVSPFAELGFSKADVRAMAQELELRIWDKPASACLASRIPYGSSVTARRLEQIGGFEADLKAMGFPLVRVRWHDRIARIEVPLEALPRLCSGECNERVVALGKQHGFNYVTVDLAGYRQGSHNEVLQGRSLRVVSG